MLRIDQVAIQRIAFHFVDDAVHHRYRLHRIGAAGGLRRQHHGIGAIVDSAGHIGCLSPGRRWRGYHRFEHLRGDNARFAVLTTNPQNALLRARDALRWQLDAKIAARYHDRIRQSHNFFQLIECLRLFQLGHQAGTAADQFTRLQQIFRTLHEGQGHPVDTQCQGKRQIAPVLFSQHRNRQHRIGHVDALAIRQWAAGDHARANPLSVAGQHLQAQLAVIQQQGLADRNDFE